MSYTSRRAYEAVHDLPRCQGLRATFAVLLCGTWWCTGCAARGLPRQATFRTHAGRRPVGPCFQTNKKRKPSVQSVCEDHEAQYYRERLLPFWKRLGPSWGPLGRSWGPLGPTWGPLGGLMGCLGAILEASWRPLGLSWAVGNPNRREPQPPSNN